MSSHEANQERNSYNIIISRLNMISKITVLPLLHVFLNHFDINLIDEVFHVI